MSPSPVRQAVESLESIASRIQREAFSSVITEITAGSAHIERLAEDAGAEVAARLHEALVGFNQLATRGLNEAESRISAALSAEAAALRQCLNGGPSAGSGTSPAVVSSGTPTGLHSSGPSGGAAPGSAGTTFTESFRGKLENARNSQFFQNVKDDVQGSLVESAPGIAEAFGAKELSEFLGNKDVQDFLKAQLDENAGTNVSLSRAQTREMAVRAVAGGLKYALGPAIGGAAVAGLAVAGIAGAAAPLVMLACVPVVNAGISALRDRSIRRIHAQGASTNASTHR